MSLHQVVLVVLQVLDEFVRPHLAGLQVLDALLQALDTFVGLLLAVLEGFESGHHDVEEVQSCFLTAVLPGDSIFGTLKVSLLYQKWVNRRRRIDHSVAASGRIDGRGGRMRVVGRVHLEGEKVG